MRPKNRFSCEGESEEASIVGIKREHTSDPRGRRVKMRYNFGSNGRVISAACFRVLSLTFETQNEVDVLKPIVDELEVLRLSCVLGALSSVNPKDFEFELLNAKDFDDELAQFLRANVFDRGVDGGPQVRVVSVFGKQAQVKKQLQRLGGWDDAMEDKLLPRDLGLYAVVLPEVADQIKTVVVFAWLVDEYFHPDRLRATPTYLLRLITCLTNEVTLCMSERDKQLLEAFTQCEDDVSDEQEWKSYSIAFHVQQHRDAEDGVRGSFVQTLRMPPAAAASHSMELIKGTYPALVAVTEAPPQKTRSSDVKRFHGNDAFCEWIAARLKSYDLRVGPFGWSPTLEAAMVRKFGVWPEEKLRECDDALVQQIARVQEECSAEVAHICEEYREELDQIRSVVFRVEAMWKPADIAASQEVINASLQELKNKAFLSVPQLSSTILSLPLRLQPVLKQCYKLYQNKHEEALDAALVNAPTMSAKSLFEDARKQGLLQDTASWFSKFFESQEIPEDFRERMEGPLQTMSEIWWTEVMAVLEQYQDGATRRDVQERKAQLERLHDKDRRGVISEAFWNVRHMWSQSSEHGLELSVTIECSPQQAIKCCLSKEAWAKAHKQMQVWASRGDGSQASHLGELGAFDLADNEKVLQVFSVQTRSVLVVSCLRDRTKVRRVEFPSGTAWLSQRAKVHVIRELGRAADICDYNCKERLLILGNAGDSISLYRLDERLSGMEIMRSVDLAVRTSLSLPIESALVFDGRLFMVDHTGAVQSLNIRSLQTSRKHATVPVQSRKVKRGQLLRVSDGSALGWLESPIREYGMMPQPPHRLRFFATEDFRELPQSTSWLEDRVGRSSGPERCQVFGDHLFMAESASSAVNVVALEVTLTSESFHIGWTGKKKSSTIDKPGAEDSPTALDHWMWCLYHLYEKFPVRGEMDRTAKRHPSFPIQLTLVCDSSSRGDTSAFEIGCSNLLETITTRLQQLNKPLYGLNLASAVKVILFAGQDAGVGSAHMSATPQAVTALLRELITFVPIQICRAEYNTLTLLSDGKYQAQSDLVDEDGSTATLDASTIAQSLRFGLLSPLLQSWRRQCVVITSMGKQSTGKSYFLNHLTGSSFAIAGARCTDGAWMSVRTLSSGVLLIVIDFEGLGSLERTEQEDVFLSVLNASVSMLTVFRMEMRLDKEIDEIFSKFQKGSQLIKNDARLFRGKLYMSVKDVNPNDQAGVVDEFGVKFQRLLEVNKEKNFLTDMYAGQLEINCSPPLGTVGYYRSLAHAQRQIDRQIGSDEMAGFPSGKAFLDCIRLLLAKISILDWTSLDETAMKFKVAELTTKLPGVLRFGCITINVDDSASQSSMVREDLVNSASNAKIEVSFEDVCTANNSLALCWREVHEDVALDQLDDDVFDLGSCDVSTLDPQSVEAASRALYAAFRHFVTLMDTNGAGWIVVKKPLQVDFDAFLSFVVRRRCLRVQKWCRVMLGDRIPESWDAVEQQAFGSLQTRLVRCLDSCSCCQLGCLKASAHVAIGDAAHDCGTNHACLDFCAYCLESDGDVSVKRTTCAKPAGHEGRCECALGDHTCRLPCALQEASNCAFYCNKKAGHFDGGHRCAAGLHKCGQPCLARGCTRECVLDVEVPHQVHKCEVDRCLSACVMDGCNRGCSSRDHFHGFTEARIALRVENPDAEAKNAETFDASSDKPTIHLCDEMHTCPELCVQDGVCHIDVFLKQSSKVFVGARGSFQYTFQEMNGSRKRCAVKMQAGQTTHAGNHSCCNDGESDGEEEQETKSANHSNTVRHYCDVRCPCCSYYCQQEYGHSGVHRTTHGNMRNTMFLSDSREIDLMDRKYAAGERGTAEMCNLYCSKMGRSHVHFLDCERAAPAPCVYNGSAEDMRRHCSRVLEPTPDKEQDEVLHERFWDTLGWEDPCTSVEERDEFGKCAFKCDAPDHDGKDPSYCVLKAWHVPAAKPSTANDGFSYVGGHQFECSHISASSKMHHVFVLDASGSMSGSPWQKLLAAFGEYVQNRITMGAAGDLVSVVTFDSAASVVWEAQSIVSVATSRVPYRGGGTSYGAGLRSVNEVLSRVAFDAYKPVIVFFSDGQPGDAAQGEQLASHISQSYAKYGLEAFAVGFGFVNLSILQRVAERLGGTYCNVLTGDELKTTFHSISASLGTRAGLALTKPMHEMICVICQKEHASEPTAVLSPCQHELHQRCLRRLMENTANGEAKQCPTCRQAIYQP